MKSRPVTGICLAAVICAWAGAASPLALAGGAPSAFVTVAAAEEPGTDSLLDRLRGFWQQIGLGHAAAESPQSEEHKVAALTPEQREQMRDQIRQQWQSATPEERERRREEFRERWESATPEQRERWRERRERFERGEGREGGRPGGPGGFAPPGR